MDVVEFGRLSESQRAELQGEEDDLFDAAGNTLHWRAKDRHVCLRRADGRLVASAGLVLGDLQVGERPSMPFVGVGGVFVSAPYRGQGLGGRVIVEALRRAATVGPELALLFCHRDRSRLYERHGFAEVDPPVFVKQPHGFVEMPLVTMWRALGEDATLPSGRVAVHSPPF